ncbi:tetratricopeptide repeat protein [Azospirillum sp. TSO35-2]|uniref:tetratricopeptide repeat protein n=1 Tax=Azospirillum sp. TSO35-2 TaxID=716796 RepID=UPI000D61559E|nr:tetratricopeptide repeat protein [Azospirillum sp. TSO35-2]PWC33020.1 hypothetical protein TSO352_20905 [Azospirillum sp. TSO35-2]
MTTADLLDAALPLHRDGRLADALALYRRRLTDDPGDAVALHLAALVAHQTVGAGAALAGLNAALAVQPRFPAAFNSLGNALADLGRLDEALLAYAAAIEQNERYAEAYSNRATVLQRLGRQGEAAESYARALTMAPGNLAARYNYGILQREMGQIAPAANAFYEVVKADPSHPSAWRHLAICLRGLGHPDAEACLRRALADAPGDQELSGELGGLLNAQARYADALAVLEPAVAAHPGNVLLRFAGGNALLGLGRLEAAAAEFRRTLEREPSLQGACNNLGVALLDLGATAEAAPVLRRAVALSPDDAMVMNNHGTALEDRRDPERGWEQPARWYRRALRLRPDYGNALINLGGACAADKDSGRADALYRMAAAADPGNAEGYAGLAGLLLERDEVAEAERLYRRSLTIAPRRPATLTGHGLALQIQGRIAEAEAAHRKALAIDPRNAEAAGNLGMLVWNFHQDATAERWMSRALALDPTLGTAHLNRGILRLTLGALADGWEDYRWRFRAKGYVNRRIAAPLWRGEDPARRRLLVWREQGVGDEILFASCYPDIIARAGHVVVECDERLVPLFRRSFPRATVRALTVGPDGRERIDPPDVDAHAPAGDLPGLLRRRLADFLEAAPWLVPDPALVASWRERLATLGPGLKVGIGWRSQLMTSDRRASYAMLDQWGPVFAVPGVTFVNLQYGECEAELAAAERRFGITIHRWPDLNLKDDFDNAAALTANLDLVISPAMSAGELAGALGVPVWRFGSRDWTQLGSGVRPWFPSMRLFQPNAGQGLEAALAGVASELGRLRRLAADRKAEQLGAADLDRRTAEAVALYRGGDAAAAETLVRRVIEATPGGAPGHPVALHLAGVLAKRRGAWEEATALLTRAAAAAPANAAAHAALCEALQALGRMDAAERASRNSVAAQPDAAEHWINRTALLRRMGHDTATPAAARAAITRAQRLRPDLALVHSHRGELTVDPGEAVAAHRVAVALAPAAADLLSNLGGALHRTERFAEAERVLAWAARCDPGLAVAWTNRGNALEALGRVVEAEACHRAAIDRDPALAEAHGNLAYLLQRQNRREEALAAFTAALDADPKHAQSHYNRSLLLLEDGNLRPGWTDHEWRFATPQFRAQRRRLAMRTWRGENIAGRRLLVWREQGVGDEILFASCYGDALRRAGRLVIECDRRLVPLFARSFPGADVRAESVDPRDADVQIAAGSLPRLLRADLKRFPDRTSWLVPDPALVARWRERLAALEPGLKVGIGWRSQLMTGDRRASYAMLDQWGAVFAVPGVTFVNLQYGECEAELAAAERRFGITIHRWSDLNLKDDFDNAAALTANLDLVISPAMSAGELAGALGVPVWRFGSRDWTQLGSGVRPWFPSMRLFQPDAGRGLEAALAGIAAALRASLPAPPRPVEAPRQPPATTPATTTPPSRDFDDLLNEAVALHRAGRLVEAEAAYRAALDADPGRTSPACADALHLLGLVHHQSGRTADALALIGEALRREPDFASAWNHLGLVYEAEKRHGEAAHAFTRALALRPDFREALTHLGLVHQTGGRVAEAVRLHRRSIAVAAENPSAQTNLGHARELEGRTAEAAAQYRRTAALQPDMPDPYNNLATMAMLEGREADTKHHLRRALRLNPDFALAAWNMGLIDLADGRIAAGWAGYARRFSARQLQRARRIDRPSWHGEALGGRRLLVWSEQGVGDEILFASCFDALQGLDGPVTVECDRRLVSLFARSFPWVAVRAETADAAGNETVDPPDCDLQAAAGNLPALARDRLDRFPPRPAYLRPDPERVALWRDRVAALPGLRVGLAWRSQVVTAQRQAAYTGLADWLPLLDLAGVSVVTLQYGDCTAELARVETASRRLHRWDDLNLKDDFEGVAALIANLDLVIAPATAVGELAGAVGTPTWRLGTRDWTQMGAGVRPWFPSMRLIQPPPGQGLADAARQAVRALAWLVPAASRG